MLIHSVYFWLKEGLTLDQLAEFRQGLNSLAKIDGVVALHVGTPAATPPRPVIDASYDFALLVILPNLAAHDTYQVHPLHKAFLAKFGDWWTRVAIYDFD